MGKLTIEQIIDNNRKLLLKELSDLFNSTTDIFVHFEKGNITLAIGDEYINIYASDDSKFRKICDLKEKDLPLLKSLKPAKIEHFSACYQQNIETIWASWEEGKDVLEEEFNHVKSIYEQHILNFGLQPTSKKVNTKI